MVWDEESIKLLQKLWEKGLSTTEIAKKLNISKNSVVGKVHRLCLKARPSPIKKKDDAKPSEQVQNMNADEQKEEDIIQDEIGETSAQNEVIVTEGKSKQKETVRDDEKCKNKTEKKCAGKKSVKNIKLIELDSHTCRWPIGDPRDEDFCFCGKKVRAGQTYCDEHSQIAYVKAIVKK